MGRITRTGRAVDALPACPAAQPGSQASGSVVAPPPRLWTEKTHGRLRVLDHYIISGPLPSLARDSSLWVSRQNRDRHIPPGIESVGNAKPLPLCYCPTYGPWVTGRPVPTSAGLIGTPVTRLVVRSFQTGQRRRDGTSLGGPGAHPEDEREPADFPAGGTPLASRCAGSSGCMRLSRSRIPNFEGLTWPPV